MEILEAIDTEAKPKLLLEAQALRDEIAEYGTRGLTPPERREVRELRRQAEALERIGTPIQLNMLLNEVREDSTPRWCIACPYRGISKDNGGVRSFVPGRWSYSYWSRGLVGTQWELTATKTHPRIGFDISGPLLPVGFPPLPEDVRSILARRDVKRAAACVVLFQPKRWEKLQELPKNPDPALLVQWERGTDWRCLAVWGHDGPHIQEFLS